MGKRSPAREVYDLACGTDHELRLERQSPEYFDAYRCLADLPAYHERTRSTYVDHRKSRQLLGEAARLELLVTSDVGASQEHDPSYARATSYPPAGARCASRPVFGREPAMIIVSTSSCVTSAVRTVPTRRPFLRTLMRSE